MTTPLDAHTRVEVTDHLGQKYVLCLQDKEWWPCRATLLAIADAAAALLPTLDTYGNPDNWRGDDWGVMSVIQSEYGDPSTKARVAANALRAALEGSE